jgi:hypothetical protein
VEGQQSRGEPHAAAATQPYYMTTQSLAQQFLLTAGLLLLSGYNRRMKPLPAPDVPGKTEYERFENALRKVLTISKDELLKREAHEKRQHKRRKKS